MKRKITADEVRRFFEGCSREFEEAGFILHNVRFVRSKDSDTLQKILLHYSEYDRHFDSDTKSPTEGAR